MKRHRSVLGWGRRAVRSAGGCLLAVALLVGMTALPAAAAGTIVANTGAISINGGHAVPYPSPITVSGLPGTILKVDVLLSNFSHTWPADVDVLLVGPSGQSVVLLADVGGAAAVTGANLLFDDAAPTGVPTPIVTGNYKPTNSGAFNGTAPAPAGPYGAALTAFNGTNPNGTWNLYVYDDFAPSDNGSIAGGWAMAIITNGPTVDSFNPTSGGPGTSVVITGTYLTGATVVTFGGVSASFTVNSSTQITATVPAAAVTGPIAVTTPNGTGVSASSFSVIPAPGITSFTPARGQVGTSVVITGSAFTGATSVAFHGTPASVFTVDSATQITATVPAGASTGPISVTTASGTGTSAANFVVRHARSISITLGNRARGTVNVSDGFAACASRVPVKIQHRVGSAWRTVASVLTRVNGSYVAAGVSQSGRYRAIAKPTKLSSGDKCMRAVSPTARK